MNQKSISIIVPTLNEVDNIDHFLCGLLISTSKIQSEINVVITDGGSTDGTQNKVNEWINHAPVRLIENKPGQGLAKDVFHAVSLVKSDIILVMDADLSHPHSAIPDILQPIINGTHDMVIGSRYTKGG